MDQTEAKNLIAEHFQSKGFARAYDDGHVVKIEQFIGKLDLQVSVLLKKNLAIDVYVPSREYDQKMLKSLLGEEWSLAGWTSEKTERDHGVIIRFYSSFDWQDEKAYDWDGLMKAYWGLRDRITPCLAQDGSVEDAFIAWIEEEKSKSDSEWNRTEAAFCERLSFRGKFKLNPFDCLKLLHGRNVLVDAKPTDAFDAIADFKKLSLKKDPSKQGNLEEADINGTYLALFKEFCREYIEGGMTREQWAGLREKYAAEIARMRNSQYIIRAFEHTENKDFENYVVLGVWHRIRTLLKGNMPRPVTQQYVRHADGHSFMDLYFPCVNIQVECDEGHHKSNIVGDQKRGKNIDETLAAIAEFEQCVLGVDHNLNVTELGVDATLPLDDIDRRLDEIVRTIAEKYGKLSKDEKENDWKKLSPVECVRSTGILNVADRLVFSGRDDVLAALQILRTSTSKKDGVKAADGYSIDWQAAPALSAEEGVCRKGVVFVKIDCLQKFQRLEIKDIVVHVPFEYCLVFVRYRDALGVDGYRFAGAFSRGKRVSDRVEI